MLDPVCQDTESERLDSTKCFLTSRPVDHHSGKIRHLGDPATVFLLFKLDGVLHETRLAHRETATS